MDRSGAPIEDETIPDDRFYCTKCEEHHEDLLCGEDITAEETRSVDSSQTETESETEEEEESQKDEIMRLQPNSKRKRYHAPRLTE